MSNYWELDISKIEQKYNAKYIGDFCVRTSSGNWSEDPSALFYAEAPDTEKGHTHYFGIRKYMGKYVIHKGDSAFENGIRGVRAENGQIIYSRYRHDYVKSDDGSVFVDGGRDYLRTNTRNIVNFKIEKDKLVEDDTHGENE